MRHNPSKGTRVGLLLDFALRQRCGRTSCLSRVKKSVHPVGLVVKDRLLVVAASGEVLEGVRIFHTKLRAMNAELRGERCKVKQ